MWRWCCVYGPSTCVYICAAVRFSFSHSISTLVFVLIKHGGARAKTPNDSTTLHAVDFSSLILSNRLPYISQQHKLSKHSLEHHIYSTYNTYFVHIRAFLLVVPLRVTYVTPFLFRFVSKCNLKKEEKFQFILRHLPAEPRCKKNRKHNNYNKESQRIN